MNGLTLLLIVGRLMGEGLPAGGLPVVTSQLIDAQACATAETAINLVPVMDLKGGAQIWVESASCGHAKDWARIVQKQNCTVTLVNDGVVKIVGCEK